MLIVPKYWERLIFVEISKSANKHALDTQKKTANQTVKRQ
jgi:hypothetical protein